MTVLQQLYPGWRDLEIHESSPGGRGVSTKLRNECRAYTASQYDVKVPFGEIHPTDGYRSENLEGQTFPDGCFDLVITQDVFEHIFHPDLAIKEIVRTLRPGGAHIMTVPIVRRDQPSRRRAKRDDDRIVHLMPPEYHANPIDSSGSLVTFDWGFDLAGYLSFHSGCPTTMFVIDDLSRGIRAECIEVVVTRRQSQLTV